jgi:rhodanese-related sulfurtransferase
MKARFKLKERVTMKKLLITSMTIGGLFAMQSVAAGCCGGAMKECKADKSKAICPTGTCEAEPAALAAAPAVKAPAAKEAVVNAEALAALLRAKVQLTLLDARSGKFDDGRRLPGAKALAPTAKDEEVTALLPDKTAMVVTYCAGLKCPASHMLSEKLRGMGYVNVIEYREGIEGWVAAGNVVEPAAK